MSRNARVQLGAPLNRKWWDEAIATIKPNYDALSDFEKTFFDDVTRKEIEVVEFGGEFNPTVKQFNFMRELARRVK